MAQNNMILNVPGTNAIESVQESVSPFIIVRKSFINCASDIENIHDIDLKIIIKRYKSKGELDSAERTAVAKSIIKFLINENYERTESKKISLNDLAKTKTDPSERNVRMILEKDVIDANLLEHLNNFSLNDVEKTKQSISPQEHKNFSLNNLKKTNIITKDLEGMAKENFVDANLTDNQFTKISELNFDKLISETPIEHPVTQQNSELLIEYEPRGSGNSCESIKENAITAAQENNNIPDQGVYQGNNANEKHQKEHIRKPLSEIHLELDDIEVAHETSPKILYNLGLQVTINFALNKPSAHVCVVVISIVNQNHLPMENYELIASVCRPCRLRTLPPTATSLPAARPLQLPTVDIRQILLIYNPTKKPVDITFIIGYTLGDDPDPLKESVVVKDIPYNFD